MYVLNQTTTLTTTFLLNAQGVSPSINAQKWKIRFIEDWVTDHPHHIPFFVLTETHLDSSHLEAEVKVRDFATIRADRVGRRKGGVAIFLHDSFTTDAKDIFSNGYCESVSVHNSANDFTIIGLYRPPQTSMQHFRECLYSIKCFIRQCHAGNILLTGDFNLPCVDWSTNTLKPGIGISTPDKEAAESLFHLMDNFFLSQLVHEPTRCHKSILDLVLKQSYR